MVLSVATEKIPSDTTGNRSRDRPTSSLNHYATPGPLFILRSILILYHQRLALPVGIFYLRVPTKIVRTLISTLMHSLQLVHLNLPLFHRL